MIGNKSIWHGIGLGIFLSIVVSTLLGWLGLGNGLTASITLYLLCYLPAGFFVAYLNPNHPYTLAAISGVVLSILNQAVAILFFTPGILAYPFILSTGILFGITAAIIGAVFMMQPWRRFMKGRL